MNTRAPFRAATALLALAATVLAANGLEPSPLLFKRVVIDEKPPQNPWITIVGDLNGDGKLDIVTKPHTWDTPRLDLWLNQGNQP